MVALLPWVLLAIFSLLEEILSYINSVAQCVEANSDKPTAKFWRALLNKSYDVLDKVMSRSTQIRHSCTQTGSGSELSAPLYLIMSRGLVGLGWTR